MTKKQPRVKVKRRAARSIRLDKNLIITQKRDDLAQNGNLCDDNRLKRIVLRLKAKMAVFLIKALYRRLVFHHRNHNLTIARLRRLLYHHDIAVVNAGIQHAFAAHMQGKERFIAGYMPRVGEITFDLLHRKIG